MIERVLRVRKRRKKRKANRMIFTEQNVLTLPVKSSQYMVWDGGNGRGANDVVRGLGILVSPAGTRLYRSFYYFKGSAKAHSRGLDRVGLITLAEARSRCKQDQRWAADGVDPRTKDDDASEAYQDVVREYVKRVQAVENSEATAREAERVLLKLSHPSSRGVPEDQIEPHPWHRRPIATITAQQIQTELELVRDGRTDPKNPSRTLKPRPYLANSLYGRLCKFFAWSVRPGIKKVTASPMVGIEKPWKGAKRRSREWFKGAPGDDAIKALWSAADQIGGVDGAYLQVLLLTGKRKSALAKMQWQEIDKDWFWHAPQADKENKRLHGIPLPLTARHILHPDDKQPRPTKGYVFPGDDEGHIYVNGSRLQTIVIRASGLADYFHHGIRHLVETKLGQLKIKMFVRDLLLDHVPSRGSGAGYDHNEYADEMLAALEVWADYIAKLVPEPAPRVASERAVLPFRRRAANRRGDKAIGA